MLMTDRLILRNWRSEDVEPFAVLNADPEVMRYFPSCLSREETSALIDRFQGHIQTHGFGFWAAELRTTGALIGMIGLATVNERLPFAPGIEVGWRLSKNVWGQGLATEGARACLAYAFSALKADEVVSFTTVQNGPSRRVMEKLSMLRDEAGDFDHPLLSEDSPLKKHVLYRISSSDCLA
jgi:RimJ/RimL family protein N-acetyltransferase